ncbi:hypothetical protein G6Z92_14665 [Vibrio aestuarianus subsp. cardii]|uniref:hypothetical protein n=1 Tax=Vibrio aestuarianus TaxID=28171 RepID=UPI0015C566DD|nr:hypothetical protein [Vibrio aestuarianus]NGZ68204.1 hypothetical protein [Vibrio aestuarianus subsp. cardii]
MLSSIDGADHSKKDTNTSQREQELAAEVAKLKRQLAEQTEELEIVKKAAMRISVIAIARFPPVSA